MTVSSRTPEGFPSHCPLCGAATSLEFSDRASDAPCPSCGHLLWFSSQVLVWLQQRIGEFMGIVPDQISPDALLYDICPDFIDTDELRVAIDDTYGVTLQHDRAQSIADVVRYIEEHRQESGG